MKINLVKPFLLCATSSLLLGCGGGSGDTEDTISSNQLSSNDFSITEKNYVTTASTFFNTALTTALPLASIQELKLFQIRMIDQASTHSACDISGEIITDTLKHPLSEKVVHVGDRLKSTYNDCKNASGSQSGSKNLEVNRLEGTYESGEYVIHTDHYQDITKSNSSNTSNNGEYNYHLPFVFGKTNNKSIELIGINLAELDANVVPNTNFPNADNEEIEHAEANTLASNPSHYSTPAATFNTFAFELIEDNTTLDEQVKYRWKFDITNKEDANASYSMQTTQQLILEERYVDESDEEDGDNLETFALDGKFNFKMATGEIITVEIFSPDAEVTPGTPIPPNVVVYFDNYGDGVIDAQAGMTWDEFISAMFVFFTP